MAGESDKKAQEGGGKGLILALVVLAVAGGAAGFGGGVFLGRDAPRRAAEPVATAGEAKPHVGMSADRATDEKPESKTAGGSPEADKAAAAQEPPPELQVLPLEAIITNVSKPAGAWARLEASLVVNKTLKDAPEMVRARVAEQIMVYLRSINLVEVEGASGLLNFRDDLNSLVRSLNPDEVHEVLIRTLVVE